MVIYNAATRELTAKIVYYGPGLGGKTTNLHLLHERLEPGTVGKLLNLATQTDRTIYFDLLPVELGDIKGYKIRFQLATVPGQTAFNETRRVVLKGADGIVFVADSQWTMLPKNLESWQNLKDNLKVNGVSFEGIPVVIQYNKRDLSDILSVDALQEALGLSSYPFVEAVASAGRGVTETFKLISKLTFVDLLRRLQGRRPEESGVRRENDDLLSWKDSLLNRATPATAAPGDKRSLALVPSASPSPSPPTNEAPFAAAEEEPLPAAAEAEGPFNETAAPSNNEESAPEALPEIRAFEMNDRPTERIERAESAEPPLEIEIPDELSDFVPAPPLPSDHEGAERDADAEELHELPTEIAGAGDGDGRVAQLEMRLEEALGRWHEERDERDRAGRDLQALTARLEAFERDARSLGKDLSERQESIGSRLDALEKAAAEFWTEETDARLRSLEERVGAAEKRQRTSEDDVSMALRSFGERGEKLHGQLAHALSQLEALELALAEKTAQSRREADDIRAQISALQASIEEKIGQGRREAEDIRSQIAPLLEAHDQRGQTDERLLVEFDRLRESLAESLGDLSERLRRAVRGI